MPAQTTPRYAQHQPEQTVLFRVVRDHLPSFEQQCKATYGRGLPKYVREELRAYLKCGIHAHGFARALCQSCGHELLVAFSCKKRGVCPSCNGRRMCDTGARTVDHVLPDIRLRQWVLSIPFELRLLLARNPEALSACGRIFVEEIFRFQRQRALRCGLEDVRGGAISFPQRFGGSLNLNVHYHVVVPDAFFYRDTAGEVHHQLLQGPSRLDLEEITHNVTHRVLRWLRRRDLISDQQAEVVEPSTEAPAPLDAFLHSSIGLGELAALEKSFGELRPARPIDHEARSASKRVQAGVFNVHAATVACTREERERLVRYCARPPFSVERMSRTPDGQIAYQLKNPIRGRTHRILSPEAFLARLCALIPPPRHPLIRFHGVLAPNSSWRKDVAPGQTSDSKAEPQSLPALSPKQLLQSLDHEEPDATHSWVSTPIDWATLLKRIYDIDALACECGGRLRFSQLVDEPSEARQELEARGLPIIETDPRSAPPPDDRDFYDPQAPQPFAPQATGPPHSASDPPADASPTIDDYLTDPIPDDW